MAKRHPVLPLIFHSDQGSQYTSSAFMDYLKEHSITQSFSKPDSPYDNAVAESFFSALKKEDLYQHIYKNINDLSEAVDEYILFHNEQRPHYSFGMATPQ